jgi:hypothetical protein
MTNLLVKVEDHPVSQAGEGISFFDIMHKAWPVI